MMLPANPLLPATGSPAVALRGPPPPSTPPGIA